MRECHVSLGSAADEWQLRIHHDSHRTDRKYPPSPQIVEALSRVDPDDSSLEVLYEEAIRDTITQFEATGSPVITDGEMLQTLSGDDRLWRRRLGENFFENESKPRRKRNYLIAQSPASSADTIA